MNFVATVDGRQHCVEVEHEPDVPDIYRMMLDGKSYTVDAKRMPSQIVSILLDNRSYDVDLERVGKPGDTLDGRIHVRVRGRVLRFEMLDERRLKMKEAQGVRFDVGGVVSIDSPMPGKVLKILVRDGEEVKAGQGVVVIEAMKMENEMRSPKDGRVTAIHVREGAAVEAGAKLVQIE